MFKPLARWILPRAIRWFDDSIPAEELELYLTRQLDRVLPVGTWSEPEDLIMVQQLRDRFGGPGANSRLEPKLYAAQLQSAQHWLEQLPDHQILQRGTLAVGSGTQLTLLLAAAPSDEQRSLLDDSLERLLRHVETQRKHCLQRFSLPLSEEQAWLERHAVTRLFLFVARSRQDWRFLNAALKLNDWAYRAHRKLPADSRRLLSYLSNLAEQQAILSEL